MGGEFSLRNRGLLPEILKARIHIATPDFK